MVTQHMNFFRNLDTVARELDARGHETVVLHGTPPEKKAKMTHTGRGLEVAESEIASLSSGYRPEPEPSKRATRIRGGRLVLNRSLYLRSTHPSPDRVVEGLEKGLPAPVKRWLGNRTVRWALGTQVPLRLWRRFEALLPASVVVTKALRDVDPDIVLVSPSVWPKNPVETDYIHAARKLGIPVVGYVNSWDNLTSKGTVHVMPDAFVVWNEAMAIEARELHEIPADVVRVTGAPHLDHFFELEPSLTRAELSAQVGVPADRPYVIYLCSSRTLIADETPIVTRIADALANRLGEKAPIVLVRPHPVNPGPWDGYEHPGVAVYPKEGDQADSPESWQDYFNQLTYAAAFVGLNTTAFLEAAVADHPCLTIVSDEFFAQQGRTGHFRHLLDADFLEVSRDEAEVAARLERVLDGADEKAEGRRRFAKDFLRPAGIDIPARVVVADTLEALVTNPRTPRRQAEEIAA
jgi:hypothetical protein